MGRSLNSLNKDELQAFATSQGVQFDDDATKADLVDALEKKGVTEAPSQEEVDQQADERQENLEDKEGEMAGGTAGGASESQQTDETQSGPGSLPGTRAETPDLDPATAHATTPLAAGATLRNPGAHYDDDAAGKPEDDPDAQPEMA